ncbi:Na+/H+ antiporter NhaA [Falsirhodobacter algicola]|uniref:Na(+)/H(+) antiporter NhaA n=1 Tax=Falsirhodobacter algicola TaxID=2692330 RepID=A0A8J8MR55_9RHOB|nr:Na+/H+ antiporter NhaA [Falsirhodobacter algicola]QUS35222.1 Na+/H+ antiporter NhaA [Falsirhodobacter algicola]
MEHTRTRPPSLIREFLNSSTSGGIVLILASAAALIVANSGLGEGYEHLLEMRIGPLPVLEWINDALMALFFLNVGLEIKREVLDGQLATWPRRVLPGAAALGGMAVPAIIFLAVNLSIDGGRPSGWAIPSATDIAFALGVLSLLGSAIPVSLRVFLAALAIIDDLGAVVIIALFYTSDIDMPMLAGAAVSFAALLALNKAGVMRLLPYLVIGAVLWVFTLESGVHATIAGVLLALTIPLRPSPGAPDDMTSPVNRLEHAINPWVTFLIVPLFGFANAGVSFEGIGLSNLLDPVPLGIAAGLFVGKQVGVFSTVWVVIRAGWADVPAHATRRQVYGVSVLCGIGFTMSLFIGLLSYADPALQNELKIGVLVGSGLSALVGAAILIGAKREAVPTRSR